MRISSPSRRAFLAGAVSAMPILAGSGAGPADAAEDVLAALAGLERRHGGRLGVAILNTANGRAPILHRGDERFPLLSTFKFLAAAYVLARVDRGEESLARRVVYTKDDLVTYSPVTQKHVGGDGLSVAEICDAAVTLSDNTAGNLLLDSFGGPAGLTAYARTLGDETTRLDRRETALNEAIPGDPRDTTAPAAMMELLQKTVLGTALSLQSRRQLVDWLVANKTGDRRIRAGIPAGWRVGDKTGTGPRGTANDVAVIWPPGRPAVIVAAYYAGASGSDDERNAVLAAVGRLAASA